MSKIESNRWWEFYLVRYLLGSMVGAIISYLLCVHFTKQEGLPFEMSSLLEKITDIEKSANQIFFLGLGFVFCYISSAPILVLHASRFSFVTIKKKYSLLILYVILIAAELIFDSFIPKIVHQISSIILCLVFLILQIYLVINNFNLSNVGSNKNLTYKRESLDKNTGRETYIETYKHLREHGNAFFIVILEITLGLILYQIETPEILIACLFFWILPGAFIWHFGNFLESKL